MSEEHPRGLDSGQAETGKRTFTWVIGTQVVSVAAGAASLVIVGRTLGPEGQGVYALAIFIPYLGQLLLNAGMAGANIHLVGSGKVPAIQVAQASMAFATVATAVGAATLGLLLVADLTSGVFPGVTSTMCWAAFASLPALLIRVGLGGVLRGLGRLRTAVLIDFTERPTALLVLICLWAADVLTITSALLSVAVANALPALLIIAKVRQTVPGLPAWALRPPPGLVRMTLRVGVPNYVGNVLQYLNYRLDLVLLGALATTTSVGLYSISYRMGELLLVLPNALGFMQISHAAAETGDLMGQRTIRLFWFSVCTVAVGGGAIGLIAGPLTELLFGPEYRGAAGPLVWLLPGMLALAGSAVLANDIAGRGRAGFNAVGAAVALAITCSLNIVLIPHFGARGAAAASSAAYTANLAAAFVGFRASTGTDAAQFVRGWRWWRTPVLVDAR